jgi:hypothetical protein
MFFEPLAELLDDTRRHRRVEALPAGAAHCLVDGELERAL